jgi:adenylate cyclase
MLALGADRGDDRLSTPHGRPIDLAFRQLAALRSDEPGIAGELGATVLEGWQRLAEAQGRGRGEVDITVLFTDLVGFSTWALEAGDERAIALLREVSNAIEPPITRRRGEVVKRLGDGLMGAFRDVDSAAQAAFEGCERLAAIEVEGYTPRLRTGIHLGRPRRVGRDYFGVDVNIAARLAELAEPGEILVSDRTLQQLDHASVTATERPFRAKGAPDDLSAHVLERV